MNYSQKISERLWNQPDKGELESRREETFIDDIIQKAILRNNSTVIHCPILHMPITTVAKTFS